MLTLHRVLCYDLIHLIGGGMRYFITFFLTLVLATTACAGEQKKKPTPPSPYINYAQVIKAWSVYTFVSHDVKVKIVNVSRYFDGYDNKKEKSRVLVVATYEDQIKLVYILFISPEGGVERHTLIGSSLFTDGEPPNPEPIENTDKET